MSVHWLVVPQYDAYMHACVVIGMNHTTIQMYTISSDAWLTHVSGREVLPVRQDMPSGGVYGLWPTVPCIHYEYLLPPTNLGMSVVHTLG